MEERNIHLNIEEIIKTPKQTICLAMIVKNETKVLERCFNSLYNDKHKIIDYWVICDTGSTDGTQELIKKYWSEKGVPGELHQHEWRNFGHNRSLLMSLAARKADYIITLDADEVFKFEDDFVMPFLDKDMYLIWSRKGSTDYQRLQLVSDKFDWYYKGICHEYLTHVEKPGNEPETKDVMQKMMNTLQRWALEGRIQPGVTKTYPLTGLTDALADLHHRQVTGKLALEILGDIKK
jgi:hypothetical protein